MKIDKADEEKLREIFNTLKYSNLNMKGNIKRSQVKGFRIPAYMQNEIKTAIDEFRRLSQILIDLDLAKISYGHFIEDDVLLATDKTLSTNINEIFKREAEKERRNDIEFELKEFSLKQTKWFIRTKWSPLAFTFIGLVIAAINLYFTTKNNDTIQKIESRVKSIEDQDISQKDSTKNIQQTTSAKFLRDIQP